MEGEKRRGRRTKEEIYEKDREEILIKILREIDVKENVLIKKENIERIYKKIEDMNEEIRRVYNISKWRASKYGKNKEMNIIRSICKINKIEILGIDKKILNEEENKYKNSRYYKFEIPENIMEKIR